MNHVQRVCGKQLQLTTTTGNVGCTCAQQTQAQVAVLDGQMSSFQYNGMVKYLLQLWFSLTSDSAALSSFETSSRGDISEEVRG